MKAGGGHSMTIGEMVRQFLTKLEWYATLFPRIPVPVQKDLDKKLKVSEICSKTFLRPAFSVCRSKSICINRC